MLFLLTNMEEGVGDISHVSSGDELMAALIFEVRNHEAIWNRGSKQYKNIQQLKLAWSSISQNLGVEEEYLKKSWRKIYDNYSKALKRRNEVAASGAPYTKLPQCKFQKELTFLKNRNGTNLTTLSTTQELTDQTESKTTTPSTALTFPSTVQLTHPSTTPVNWIKRKRNNEESLDLLIKTLEKNNEKTKDDDELFLLSLVPQMKRLTSKKNNLARIQMQQLLFDMEYSTED